MTDQWCEAVAGADGQLADKLVACTVESTRNRSAVWFDEQGASEHPVAFSERAPSLGRREVKPAEWEYLLEQDRP